MPRHEPVGVLDQPLEEPPLRRADVRGRLHDHRIDPGGNRRRRAKRSGEPILDIGQVSRAAVLVERIRRSERRRGGKHDDPVRDSPPGGRLDLG